MSIKRYHKLVRDRIPEIIEASGKTCTYETLPDEDYLRLLDEKLNEELAEYQESKSLEELGRPAGSHAGSGEGPRLDDRATGANQDGESHQARRL